MKKLMGLLAGTLLAGSAGAASPVGQPSKLDAHWQAKTRAIYQHIVEAPTVTGRGQMPALANWMAEQLKAGGFAAEDIQILPYKDVYGDGTATLIARWRAGKPKAKPILLMGHLDVVEAKREDWKEDPFKFIEKDGYFYGRGSLDNKSGVVGITAAVLKLKAAGFKPTRDLILFFTGDEETGGIGARLGSTEWKQWTDAEYALNSDGGGGGFKADGTPLGYGLQTAEKISQNYLLTVRNRGGHSSRPRPDNAIYELSSGLKAVESHRFAPTMNETSRAYFQLRAKQEGDSALGRSIKAWLANPADGAAADAIEANELEVGLTRTRCVATRLEGGHADNALPQMAQATVNCRMMPGATPEEIRAELQQAVGKGVEVTLKPGFIATAAPASPLRADLMAAYEAALQPLLGKQEISPVMSTGASDGRFFRAAGVPVYGMDATWIISPDDERAHGLDERTPVKAVYDNVLFWESVLKRLAGR